MKIAPRDHPAEKVLQDIETLLVNAGWMIEVEGRVSLVKNGVDDTYEPWTLMDTEMMEYVVELPRIMDGENLVNFPEGAP